MSLEGKITINTTNLLLLATPIFPGKWFCVAGHMPREKSRYTWFAIEGGANITAQVVSTNTKRSPLTQGGLEIEIKVTVLWENKKNFKIFAEK